MASGLDLYRGTASSNNGFSHYSGQIPVDGSFKGMVMSAINNFKTDYGRDIVANNINGFFGKEVVSTSPSAESSSPVSPDSSGSEYIPMRRYTNPYEGTGIDPFGSSASSQPAETPQPYAFMDTSLASLFGMDPATHYQEALANTAYQRQVRDLQAAGLNPVLGLSGSGAAVFPGRFGGYVSGGSSSGSVGSGKSTSSLSETAHTLSYWLPTLANGVVNLAVSLSPAGKANKFAGYAAGHIAQNIVSGALGAIRNHAK